MSDTTPDDYDDELTELAEKFGLPDAIDPQDIPEGIERTMWYIERNTGLLGDYHDGVVRLGEAGSIIQWYARSRYASSHDDLLQWVQMENDEVMLGQVGYRTRSEEVGTQTYIEIHPTERWGYEPTSLSISDAGRCENVFVGDEMLASYDTETGELAVYDPKNDSEDADFIVEGEDD